MILTIWMPITGIVRLMLAAHAPFCVATVVTLLLYRLIYA